MIYGILLIISKQDPFQYYKTSQEIIKLAVMYYVRYPLSLRQVEGILHERGIDICHKTVRYWCEFGLSKNSYRLSDSTYAIIWLLS